MKQRDISILEDKICAYSSSEIVLNSIDLDKTQEEILLLFNKNYLLDKIANALYMTLEEVEDEIETIANKLEQAYLDIEGE